MKHWFTAVLLVGTLAACLQTTNPVGAGSTPIKAVTGGVVVVGEAKLTIPPGALSQDANITLTVSEKASADAADPLQPVGPGVGVDLGGSSLTQPATLELPLDAGSQDGSLVILENDPDAPEGEPSLWLHAPAGGPTSASLSRQTLPSRLNYSFLKLGTRSLLEVYLARQPKPSEILGGRSMQVPFYWQDGLPWCTPTSLAMALNTYQPQPSISANPKFPSGYASNYGLASLIKQNASSASSVGSILKAASIPSSAYTMMRWDAELIASKSGTNGGYGAFEAYVTAVVSGTAGKVAPKPVWTSSDRLWHAFVITGVTETNVNDGVVDATRDGVYINDGNARWNGSHPKQTWEEFYNANCTLADANDPSKGCAKNGDTHPDLYTLVFKNDPKPETERRGSIELGREPTSLKFSNPSGKLISMWDWQGTLPNGSFLSEENRSFLGPNLAFDAELAHLIPRSSTLDLSFNVINVSDIALDFEVESRLLVGGVSKAQKTSELNVGAYNRGFVAPDFGFLADLTDPIAGPTPARLEITLRQNGVVQDIKHINFKLAPDPSEAPTVRVLVPSAGTSLVKGETVTFKGEGFDAHSLPDAKAQLLWFEGATQLAAGSDYTTSSLSVGSHTLSLIAKGEYGTQATATVQVNVIDPTRTPGEIVIVSPLVGREYGEYNNNPFPVALIGYATYANGAPVPGDKLVWTNSGSAQELGRGSSITTTYGCGGPGSTGRRVRLTVLSADGTPIGSTTVDFLTPGCVS